MLCAPARLVRSAASWQLVAAAGAEPEPLNLQLVSATNSCYPAPGHRAPGSCSCTCTFSSPGAGSVAVVRVRVLLCSPGSVHTL